FAPVVSESKLDDDMRTVRFGNGLVISERILDVDDGRRRVAYSAVNASGIQFHHASMQVFDIGANRCRFVWITDFHPKEVTGNLSGLIEQGAAALKQNLEKS
ncbi:MAG TPA: SRPBCC family protein, partial [Gemmatimonadaceae bacterium]|nr:SRPBCC family protein [Gemmatimonadaceae bacterium]